MKQTGYSEPVELGVLNQTPAGFMVYSLDYRVPRRGEIYVAKDMTLKRCCETHYSRRSKKQHIVWTPYRKSCVNGLARNTGEARS